MATVIATGKGGPEQLSCIPKLRKGGYFPSFLEPHRMAEKTVLASDRDQRSQIDAIHNLIDRFVLVALYDKCT
jgi:hypothetical protein